MKIIDLIGRIEDYTPTGYTFYSVATKEQYNYNKSVVNSFVMVAPNPYPSEWKEGCSHEVTFDLLLGKVRSINQTTTGTFQDNPYSSAELQQELHDLMNDTIGAINTDDAISVLRAGDIEFIDLPQGGSVNAQAWVSCRVTCRVWSVPTVFVTFGADFVKFGTDYVTF